MQLSVVVAAQDGGAGLESCLRALAGQIPGREMEVLVAAASEGNPRWRERAATLSEEFPEVRFLWQSGSANVPLLWTAGIDAARGGIVGLTIENCRPASDWAARMLAAHGGDWSCVGGAIEPDANGRMLDWAIYFCRYTAYLLPFVSEFREDVAADNCSYKREALASVRHLANDGFWEALIHREMRRRGQTLRADPAPVVTWMGGISGWRFLRRRYDHGRYFADRRARGLSGTQRTIRALGSPAVPLLLLNRMAGRIRAKGRFKQKFLVCLPLIAAFLTAWAVGEGMGYLAGYSGSGPE